MRVRFLTVAALLLLVVTAVTWARSYLPEYSTLRPHRGTLYLIFFGQYEAVRIDPVNHPSRFEHPPTQVDTAQILTSARNPPSNGVGTETAALGFEFVATGRPLRWNYFVVGVPFWALCLPPAALAAWGGLAWRRQRRREFTGRCLNCGYDLRGSPGNCPECGAAAAKGQSAVGGTG